MMPSIIEKQLVEFVKTLLSREDIDVIVCGERKGTAVMRALLQELPLEERVAWMWPKVVSTASMDKYDWAAVKNDGKVLMFEELVHHGTSLDRDKSRLSDVLKHYPNIEIITAGFAVWDKCASKPKYSYYSAVNTERYEEIREDIIKMLQKYGSLLLDTEHIEVRVRIDCGIREFYKELARSSKDGNTFSFLSSSERLNLSIQDPDIVEPSNIEQWLTKGSDYKNVVRKLRVIEKNQNEFSLLPIFYPNVRMEIDDEWISRLPDFINRDSLTNATPKQVFYIVGLLSSIELLKSAVIALKDLRIDRKAFIDIPEEGLTHLCVMFPFIDTEKLLKYVGDEIAKAAVLKPLRSRRDVNLYDIDKKTLLNLSYYSLSHLRKALDEEEKEEWDIDKYSLRTFPVGRSYTQFIEIINSAKSVIEFRDNAWTAVPDSLIDNGLLVTKAEEITGESGDKWVIRTFEPDGEIVSGKLRRQIAVKGLKWLPLL